MSSKTTFKEILAGHFADALNDVKCIECVADRLPAHKSKEALSALKWAMRAYISTHRIIAEEPDDLMRT